MKEVEEGGKSDQVIKTGSDSLTTVCDSGRIENPRVV